MTSGDVQGLNSTQDAHGLDRDVPMQALDDSESRVDPPTRRTQRQG
jgi:hypothetical protein